VERLKESQGGPRRGNGKAEAIVEEKAEARMRASVPNKYKGTRDTLDIFDQAS
jgi:hypothetical protein